MWKLSWRTDPLAREVMDRHYSRQKVGSVGFVQSASCLVLRYDHIDGTRAVWVTVNPKPEYVLHRWAGAWQCAAFRNETPVRASDLIREAVAMTRWRYGPPPALGMITFVDPTKVAPNAHPGWCFLKAGFHYVMEGGKRATTMDGSKIVLHLASEAVPTAQVPDLSAAPWSTKRNIVEAMLVQR